MIRTTINSIFILLYFFSYCYSDEIKIISNKLSVDRDNRVSIFTGEVYAYEKNLEIWADEITLKFKKDEDKIQELLAVNKVKIVKQDITATGSRGIYYPLEEKLQLYDDVEVLENNNSIKCDELILDIKNSTSIMKSVSKNRVEATITTK